MDVHAKLVLRYGGLLPELPLSPATFVCGRDTACDIVISEPSVSRRHARLHVDEDGSVRIEDLQSSTGTFVNGERIERATLNPGDVVRFGSRVEYELARESTDLLHGTGAGDTSVSGVRRLQALIDVAQRLNSATVLSDVLEHVLQAAIQSMSASRGVLALTGEDGSVESVTPMPPVPTSQATTIDDLLKQAMAARRTVTAGRTPSGHHPRNDTVATPLVVVRRPIGPPQLDSVVARLEVIGGLLVERDRGGGGFSRADVALLESLATDAALAIDGARLYREARDKTKIEHEMRLARAIQESLLRPPAAVPFCQVHAWSEPARSVGGDLYHGVARADGTLALSLGDVSGKGVGAALGMAMAQGLLELIDNLRPPLADVPGIVNRSLLPFNAGNRFLTLASAIVHPHGQLDIVNAGHCPPAVVKSSGAVDFIPSGGPILGVLPSGTWVVETRQLDEGDTLVLYSDGVSESESPSGEEFGLANLARHLSALSRRAPREMAEELLSTLDRHRAGRPAGDDVTLLIARFTG